MSPTIARRTLQNGWTSYFVQIEPQYITNTYDRRRALLEALEHILKSTVGNIKIAVDCDMCTDLIDLVRDYDFSSNLLAGYRMEGNLVKLIPV